MNSVFASNKRMKSQAMMFEQVLLFIMGVTIFIMYFAVFNIYQNYFMSVNVNDQLSQIKSYVSSNILKLASSEAASSINLKIPKRIANEVYRIELSENGINVTSLVTGIYKHSNLYNLNESMTLRGSVMSLSGKVIIYKTGNEIRLI